MATLAISSGHLKYFVWGKIQIRGRIYQISPIMERDRGEVCALLNGQKERVDRLIQTHLQGEPWSGYVLRDETDRLAGLWTLEYGMSAKELLVTRVLSPDYENKGITNAAWRWTTDLFLPALYKRGAAVREVPMEFVTIVAYLRPEDKLTQHKITQAGLRAVSNRNIPGFGVRYIYECRVDELLKI